MRIPARVRILVSSLGLAGITLLTVVATALADSGPGPIGK
jgi:hypothetical protein